MQTTIEPAYIHVADAIFTRSSHRDKSHSCPEPTNKSDM